MTRFAPLVTIVALTACNTDYGMYQELNVVEDTTVETSSTSSEGTSPVDTTSPGDPPDEDDCDHTSDLVYVIDRSDARVYTFDPVTLSYHLEGQLSCTPFGTPGSMGVARDGFAYVRYSDDAVYKVDLATFDCTPTNYGTNFGSFGMGFATDSADTWRDKLYVANDDTLAILDTQSWGLNELGGVPSVAELTGNADGELWAFLPLEFPAKLVQVDKDTGAALEVMDLDGFPDPFSIDAFAFATWGGDFWLFVRQFGMGNTTDVYKVTANGVLTMAAPDTGMDIVGAGVSTCAPTE